MSSSAEIADRVFESLERTSTILEKLEIGSEVFGPGAGLAATICGWFVVDEATEKRDEQFQLLFDQLLIVDADVKTSNDDTNLQDGNRIINDVIGALNDYSKTIAEYDGSDNNAIATFIISNVGEGNDSGLYSELPIHKKIKTLLLDAGNPSAFIRLFTNGSEGQNYFDYRLKKWVDAGGNLDRLRESQVGIARLSLADYFETFYLQMVELYVRARFLHDSALGLLTTLLYDKTEADWANLKSSDHAKTYERVYKDLRSDFAPYDRAGFFATHCFDAIFAADLNTPPCIDWTLLTSIIADARKPGFSAENAYEYRGRLQKTGDAPKTAWALFSVRDYMFAPPGNNCFITGMKLNLVQLRDAEQFVALAVWYSQLDGNGGATCQSFLEQPLPAEGVTQAKFVRVGGFNSQKLAGLKTLLASNEALVLLSLGIRTAGFGSHQILDLVGEFGKLTYASDGKMQTVSKFEGDAGQVGTEVTPDNYLRMDGGGDDNDVRYVDASEVGRQMADGSNDPTGLIEDVWIGRDARGSTLFLSARVNDRRDLLRGLPPPLVWVWNRQQVKVTPDLDKTGVGLTVVAKTWAMDDNGGLNTKEDATLPVYYYLSRHYGRRLLVGLPDASLPVVEIDAAYLAAMPEVSPLVIEGTYFKTQSNNAIYFIENGNKRWMQTAGELIGFPEVQVFPDQFASQLAKIPLTGDAPPA